jgi:hypothetical protein
MVTTTRRGWPALEPALLAFAVVVCGSVSLLAMSHVSASDCRDRCDATTSSSHWTAAVSDQDSLDDGDDDDAQDGLVALSIVLTSDDAFGRLLVQTDFDVAARRRSEHLVPRGPPHRTRNTSDSHQWTVAVHDSVDDGDDDSAGDDDDDGIDDAGNAIAALTSVKTGDGSSRPVPQVAFGIALTLWSEHLASRGPPPDDRNSPVFHAHDSEPSPQDSSDVDVTDSDDDDDDDDDIGGCDGLAVAATCGGHSILIPRFDHLLSFASHDLSLRAPPR